MKRVLLFSQIEVQDTSGWHRDLLKISLEEGIITNEIYQILSRYLSFRHFFIHSYSFVLKWKNLKPLVDDVEKVLNKFKSAVYVYINKKVK